MTADNLFLVSYALCGMGLATLGIPVGEILEWMWFRIGQKWPSLLRRWPCVRSPSLPLWIHISATVVGLIYLGAGGWNFYYGLSGMPLLTTGVWVSMMVLWGVFATTIFIWVEWNRRGKRRKALPNHR